MDWSITKPPLRHLKKITQFVSCEFAVRPFIIRYEKEMLAQMHKWSNHEHEMVRRLASEGSRPRLPWGMAIASLKKDPAPIMPLLENLKNDDSETVRRSVANNLNDISKDNPELVIKTTKNWYGKSSKTDRLLKHGCRTLLKQGNLEVMELFGVAYNEDMKVADFKILTPQVKIGEYVTFKFKVLNTANEPLQIRLEYGLYYQKANGTLSKKVFKISEKTYPENSVTEIIRKQSFKLITTRKFHLGQHQVSIIVNGKEFDALDFELVE